MNGKSNAKFPSGQPADQIPAGATIYNGPVIQVSGDQSQVAWGNKGSVHQRMDAVAQGYERYAEVLAALVRGLPTAGLSPGDQKQAMVIAGEALHEVTKTEPDPSKVKPALMTLRGLLAPIALGMGHEVTGASQAWTHSMISQLSDLLA